LLSDARLISVVFGSFPQHLLPVCTALLPSLRMRRNAWYMLGGKILRKVRSYIREDRSNGRGHAVNFGLLCVLEYFGPARTEELEAGVHGFLLLRWEYE